MAEVEAEQMCLSCGERLATTANGTVPLCAKCAARIKNPRGVEYEAQSDEPEPDDEGKPS